MGSDLRAAETPARKPNIIFIFADQMRAHVLGCYGNEIVPTPNFDAMARAGTVCDNAISTWPVCSPYRAMLLTGLHPMANGTVSNDVGYIDGLPSIATACREQGYATGYIGKWHLEWNRNPFVPKDRRMGFDYWAVNNCTHQYMDHFYCTDTPAKIHFKGYDAFVQTDLAIDYIKRNASTSSAQANPFCLFVSWGPPHDPYNKIPEDYKKRVPLDSIKLRQNVHEREIVDWLIARDEPTPQVIERRKKRRAILDDDERLKKEQLQGYYAHTTALDDCIGKLREALKEEGIAEDTILVFASDHGDMLGCHRMSLKQMPFEESIRVPFLVEYAKAVPAGRRSDVLVAPIDIMPTLLSLAGLACPAVDGKDLAGAMKGGDSDQQDAVLITKMVGGRGGGPYCFNAITPWHGVRTKRYTYVNLMGYGPWLLYDNQEDPYQLNNLLALHSSESDVGIGVPEHAERSATLEKRMRELMKDAGDPGDSDKVAAYIASRQPKKK
ncbi:MAG: sulfatase [Verrucomicrobia bacterium]|nr:sulfatase [Verrucomicrobiota bacterium]